MRGIEIGKGNLLLLYRERVEEATVQSGGEPLSELNRSGAGGSRRRRKRGRGLCLVVYHQRGWNLFSPSTPLPVSALLPVYHLLFSTWFLCCLPFWSCCWLPFRQRPSCSPIGRHPIRWEGWGSSRATGVPDRSRLPLAAATTTSQPPKSLPSPDIVSRITQWRSQEKRVGPPDP